MLCFLAMFAKGLLMEDIKDAANFLGRQESWLQTIYIFVNVEHYEDFRNNFYLYEEEAQSLINGRKSQKEIWELLYNSHSSFEDKDFILTLQPEDIFSKSSLIVHSSDTLKNAISLTEEGDNFVMYKSLMTVLNYYNNFLSAIIKRNNWDKANYEGLVEASAYSLNYFWANREMISQRYVSYIARENLNKSALEDVLVFHETNIRVLLAGTDFFSVYGGLQYVKEFGEYQESFLNLLEDFVIKLLTVYQSCCNPEASREIFAHVRQIIDDAYEDHFPMSRLDIKVELNSLQFVLRSLKKEQSNKENREKVGKKKIIKRIQADQFEQKLRTLEELIDKHENETER